MKMLKEGTLLLIGTVFFMGSIYLFLQKPAPARFQRVPTSQVDTFPVLKVGENSIVLEIADTDETRTQGLSDREVLEVNHGMLFIFPEAGDYGFWMKDMHFPLDIIFLDVNLRVINVYQGVKPETFPTPYYPVAPAKYVLELNSGEASRLGIDTGVQVILDK